MPILSQQYRAAFEAANGDTLDLMFRASSEVDAEECAHEYEDQLTDEEPGQGWRLVNVRGPFAVLPGGQGVACQSV